MQRHHGTHEMRSTATRPQLAVVGLLTILALVAGVVIPANLVNLDASADEVGDVIMPPGMIMTNDQPPQAMREMGAVHAEDVDYTAPASARGDRPLQPEVVGGVKRFKLDVSVIRWSILTGQEMLAYAFNRQVPGPRIRMTQGDRVRIDVTNRLPEPTTVHWHGFILPNAMDGPAEIVQDPIEPGDTSPTSSPSSRRAPTSTTRTGSPTASRRSACTGPSSSIRPTPPATPPTTTTTTW